MKSFKFKKSVSIFLSSSLLLFSSIQCYAEKGNEEVLLSGSTSPSNMLTLNAYYDSNLNKIFSEMCVFSDEKMPEIYCSYDNENFILTNASNENNFSFTPNENFEEIYVKAIQIFDDGTTYKSDTKIVNISANLFSTCSDYDDNLGYIPDEHLGEAITVIPRSFGYIYYLYPDGSYFSETGVACTCHSYCNCDRPGDCTVFHQAIQCDGFAQMVYYETNNKYSESNLTNYNGYLTADKAKALFKSSTDGKVLGTYLRVRTNNGYPHSIAISLTYDDRVIVYHANYGGACLVRYQGYTWDAFVKAFPYLYYYTK